MRSFSICRPCLRSFLRQHSQCESTSGRRTRAFHSARATWAKDDENSTSTPENPAAQTNAQLQHDQKKADQEMTDLLRQFSAVYPESKPPATTPNPVKPLDLQHDQKNVEQYPPKEPPTTTTNRAKHSDVREDRNNAERASSISPPNGRATTQNNQKEPEIRYNQKLVEQEMKSLLEKFGLAEIEDKSTDNGVEITSDNRIIIKDPSRAKAKHKTILVLSPAPASLSMRDFRKLIKTGKHMEGWKSGGLEEVIPVRRHQDMRPLSEWVLIFSTPWDAYIFQHRADTLRKLARKSMPTSPTSGIQPPADLSTPELEGFTIRDYTLGTPWQPANLFAHLHPFPERIQTAIDLHRKIVSSSRKTSQAFPVRVWVDEKHKLALEPEVVKYLLLRDGELRGSAWEVVDSDDAFARITGDLRHEILDEGKVPTANLGPKPSDNIRILFKSESEARRFVRVWHRTPIPGYVALNLQEAEAVLKAECLFYTDNY